jgi:hypothetical protein
LVIVSPARRWRIWRATIAAQMLGDAARLAH